MKSEQFNCFLDPGRHSSSILTFNLFSSRFCSAAISGCSCFDSGSFAFQLSCDSMRHHSHKSEWQKKKRYNVIAYLTTFICKVKWAMNGLDKSDTVEAKWMAKLRNRIKMRDEAASTLAFFNIKEIDLNFIESATHRISICRMVFVFKPKRNVSLWNAQNVCVLTAYVLVHSR